MFHGMSPYEFTAAHRLDGKSLSEPERSRQNQSVYSYRIHSGTCGIEKFQETPYAETLKATGVITSYICPLMYMNNPLSEKMPVITSSNKLRTYTSARYYTDAEILEQITKGGADR